MQTTPQDFLKNHTLLFDGAMGTYLAQQYRSLATKCEQLNIEAPERVLAAHRAYILAGANAIKTNTFGANCALLDCDVDGVNKIITAGFNLAMQAANEVDRNIFVFADIGPIPTYKDEGTSSDTGAAYRQIIDRFIELGCQCFLFETFPDKAGLPELCDYIKKRVKDAFIITSFAVKPDGFTVNGSTGAELFATMQQTATDAVGFNCVSGPYHLKEYIKTLPNANKLLSVMPNAGYPTVIANRTHFGSNPTYFADQICQIAANGAKIVGGCCGTTPEHIAAIAEALANANPADLSRNESNTAKVSQKPLENHFRQKATTGQKLLAVELEPPMNAELGVFMQKAEVLKNSGVDIITVPDCPIGRARMDSSLLACKLKRELGIDVLPHLTCRDRNLNAIKALLLGLSAENINNILIITGDPIPTAERDEIKSVFNFNSRMLARFISSLNENELATPFYICGALNVNALNFDIQLNLAREKIKGGVNMLLTQPILSNEALYNLKRAKQELDVKILAGIMPVMSYRNAMFMNNEVSGINVCPEICRLYENKTKDEGRALAVKISSEIAKHALNSADGLYMISPFNRVDVIADICENLRSDGLL